MTGFWIRAACFVGGLYVGKHYPQYVPLPRIDRAAIDKALNELERMTKEQEPPVPPTLPRK